ncbi:hypothetical protein PO909_026655 [Leuciscus waleckii]
MFEEMSKEDKCLQVLMDLVDMNLSLLNGIDPSALDESIRTKLNGKIFLKCARKCIFNGFSATLKQAY